MRKASWLTLLFTGDRIARLYSVALITSVILLADGLALLSIARRIGTYTSLACVAATGLIGALAATNAYRASERRMEKLIAVGTCPSREFENVLVTVFGTLLLIIPGLVTDAVGLLAVLPPGRWLLRLIVRRRFGAEFIELYEHLRAER